MSDAAKSNVWVHAGVTYFERGYHPIPLRRAVIPADKPTPIAGVTGRGGRYLTRSQLEPELSRSTVVGLGLRMSADLVGIDVDVYRGGGETFLELIEEHGALPPTCISHSNRGDGSGIRLYRVPVGTALVGSVPGIEIIQHWHRYVIAAPSRHPEGRTYGWLDEEEKAECDGPWDFEDLPALPWAWIDGLRGHGPSTAGYAATSEQVASFLRDHRRSDNPGLLNVVLRDASDRVLAGISRHDTLAVVLPWAMRDVRAGMYPAALAIDTIESWWLMQFGVEGRKPDEGEFDRVLMFAIGAALDESDEDIEDRAQRVTDDFDGQTIDQILAAVRERLAQQVEQSRWNMQDVSAVLMGDHETVTPDMLMLPGEDSLGLLYSARLNEIHADSGVGKSWVIAHIVKERALEGHTTLVIDIEDTLVPLVQRLRQIGLPDTLIERHLTFIHPDEEWSVAAMQIVIDGITRRGVTHVFIDSLGEAFALDGVSENADDEVGPWNNRVPRRIIAATGAGVTLIDHITKAADNPLHPSGSKRKRAAITGASWFLYAIDPFTKERGGRIRFKTGKDRHGNYRYGDDVADLVMDFVGPMCRTHMERLAPPEPDTRGTTLDDEITRLVVVAVEKHQPPSGRALHVHVAALMKLHNIKGSTDMIRGCIDTAVDRGFIVAVKGTHRAVGYRYVSDFEPLEHAEWVRRRESVKSNFPGAPE